MTDYARIHDFTAKDALTTGNPLKVIKGSEVDAELDSLVTHVATKIDEPAAPSNLDILQYVSGAWTAVSNLVPPGIVMPYSGLAEPSGWLFCFGQSVSTTTYAALFAVIDYTYGGSGASFTLPDLRGRVVAGRDDMGTVSANRLTDQSGGLDGDVLGDTGGLETHTLTVAELAAHSHSIVPHPATAAAAGSGGASFDFGVAGTNTGVAGSSSPHNNVQPTIILNYLIKT